MVGLEAPAQSTTAHLDAAGVVVYGEGRLVDAVLAQVRVLRVQRRELGREGLVRA
jgi:hypothetical protein